MVDSAFEAVGQHRDQAEYDRGDEDHLAYPGKRAGDPTKAVERREQRDDKKSESPFRRGKNPFGND